MNCENILGLPQEKYGLDGIAVGNFLRQEIEKQGNGINLKFNPLNSVITILNTSNIDHSLIRNIINQVPIGKHGWYPLVKEERNQDGNLEIELLMQKIKKKHLNAIFDTRLEKISYKCKLFSPKESLHINNLNILGLPREKYGLHGIAVGNFLSQEIEKQDNGIKLQFNPLNNIITILNSSNIDHSFIRNIIDYSETKPSEYTWYPHVKEERNQDGNLEIELQMRNYDKGFNLEFDPCLERITIKGELSFPEEGLNRWNIYEKKKCPEFNEGIISKEQKAVSEAIINAMNQYCNKHEMFKGIWYPFEYKKFLWDEFEIEMDDSFLTGFANPIYFDKISRFTFRLKEGKLASEALLSFLEGGTIADCGNVTMACQYKALLDILGEESFNKIFSSKDFALTITQKGITDVNSPISYLACFKKLESYLKGIVGKRPLQIGEECYFGGIRWYGNKHPEGLGGGWHVIYKGDNEKGEQLFLGHGFQNPLTEKEINQKLLDLYNEERTTEDVQFINRENKPNLYERDNVFLKFNYIISQQEIETNPKLFMLGFDHKVQKINVTEIIKLKNAEDSYSHMLRLKHNKIRVKNFIKELIA